MSTVDSSVSVLADTKVRSNEIVFIESNVADYQSLIKGIDSAKEIYVLDAATDGLTQMAKILAGRSGIDAIHIISHGTEGAVQLGSVDLSEQNLQSRVADLVTMGSSLNPDGDILLYGCNAAKGQAGIDFIGRLAQATGADVAASSDFTGDAGQGGNWVLEVSSSDQNPTFPSIEPVNRIETLVALNEIAQESYDHLLVLPPLTQTFTAPDYWNSNTGVNTVDGFSLSVSPGVNRGIIYEPDLYFEHCVQTDGSGFYYYELIWTADNTDLGTFDLDKFSIQNYGTGGCDFRLDFTGSNAETKSFNSTGFSGPIEIFDIDQTKFNDISYFKLRVTITAAASDWADATNLALKGMVLEDLKPPGPTVTLSPSRYTQRQMDDQPLLRRK